MCFVTFKGRFNRTQSSMMLGEFLCVLVCSRNPARDLGSSGSPRTSDPPRCVWVPQCPAWSCQGVPRSSRAPHPFLSLSPFGHSFAP